MLTSFGWGCLLIVSFALIGAAVSAGGDSATGTLQVAKDRVELKHAFAVMEEDPFSNGEKENLTVLLSDIPVPDELRRPSNAWRSWVVDQAVAGSLHGLILTIDPSTKVWDAGHVVTKQGLMFYTESVMGGADRNLHFEASGEIGAQVTGKLAMKEPMHGMSDEDGPWKVEAQFSAPVVRRPAVTATLSGKQALDSPQYKAAMAFFEASKKKDVTAILASVEARSRDEMNRMLTAPDKDDTLNGFAQMADSALSLKLERVTVRGDTAGLEFKSADGANSQTIHVALSAGEWKIAR